MADNDADPPTKNNQPQKPTPTPIHIFIPPPPPPPRLPLPPPSPSHHQKYSFTHSSKCRKPTSPRKVFSPRGTTTSSSSMLSSTGRQPLYRGVRSRSGKWVSEIREPKKTRRIWLGTYPSPEMAAAAYDVAALALKGIDTLLNFPDHVSVYPIPSSSSPADIRTAASSAAAMMKSKSMEDIVSSSDHQIIVGCENNLTSDNARTENIECVTSSPPIENYEFIDEEEIFDMPNLLVDMAEGMLVSPPRMMNDPSLQDDYSSGNNMDDDLENLWNYP